jgi:hypothetical protein
LFINFYIHNNTLCGQLFHFLLELPESLVEIYFILKKNKQYIAQVIQSSLRILSEKMQSDIGLLRKPVFSLEKPVGSDLDFVGIFAAEFRTGLRRKRSDRFPSNPTVGYCRKRPNLMLGKSRIIKGEKTHSRAFEWLGMAANGSEWIGNGCEWLGMDWDWIGMDGNGLRMDRNGLGMDGNG